MTLHITLTTEQDAPIIRNLFQFYVYEFSRFMRWPPEADGRFTDEDLDGCWVDPNRHTYLFRVDGAPAGFAIIDYLAQSRYTTRENITSMSEFFITAGFQGRGFGQQAAFNLFDRYPTTWEVFQLAQNSSALAFWRRVIGRYTKNTYEQISYGELGHTVQFFESRRASTSTR